MKYSSFSKIIGQNIKEARLKAGVKGETLAKELGITKAAISQMENGFVDIKVSMLHKIADFLDIDVCSLVAEKTLHSSNELKKIKSVQKTVLVDTLVVSQLINKIEHLNQHIAKINSTKKN